MELSVGCDAGRRRLHRDDERDFAESTIGATNSGRADASIGSFDWLGTGLRLRGGVRAARRGTPRSYFIADASRLAAPSFPDRAAERRHWPTATVRVPGFGTAPKPSRLSCPLPAVRSTPYPPRADARDYAPAQMTGHKFLEMGRRGAAALGVAQMNACRLGAGSRVLLPP